MNRPLSIGVLVEERYLTQGQPKGMIAELMKRGHKVHSIVVGETACEVGVGTWLETFDLIVVRGRGWPLLWMLGWAESNEIPTINRRNSIASVYNKADMGLVLAKAGLPVPRTYVGSIEKLKSLVPAEEYPLILKPVFGDNCRGLIFVENPEKLGGVEWREETALAQHYLPSDGNDLKLYGIGGEIWAVRKPSPFIPGKKGLKRPERIEVTPELRALGLRCANLFGLDLYGVDCIETADGPMIIEVNDFPNYTSVPESNKRLADHVTRYLRAIHNQDRGQISMSIPS